MKKFNYHLHLIICLFVFLIFQISCTKNDIKSSKDDSVSDNKNSNEIIKNYIPAVGKIVKKSDNEIPLSSISSSWPSSSYVMQLKISGCGGSFSRSYGGSGYYLYPQDTIDVTSTVEGSIINVNVSAYDTPNKFTIYNSSGGVVASSPWMGYADYGGPWGQSLNTNSSGTLYFTKSSSSIYYLKVETSVNTITDSYNATVSCTAPSFITKTFAGVSIKYYASTGLLHFNSSADAIKVINSLDSSYEAYNANYESQYSSLTPDQLDVVDSINNFDEFYPFRQFEALFPGYVSKRSQLEGIENTWANNGFTGADPDSLDPTFDDADNTVLNTSNKFIISFPNPLTIIAQILASAIGSDPCFTNKGKHIFTPEVNNRRFKLKVGIKAFIGVTSTAAGKVVSFKKKNNGSWKRARMNLSVSVGGTVHNSQCNLTFGPFVDLIPSPSGFRKRKQLKSARRKAGETWYAKSGTLSSGFEAQGVAFGTLALQ